MCERVMEMLIFLLRREGKYDDPAIFSVSPISLPVDEHYEFNQHRGFFLLISNTYIDHHYSSLGLCIKERWLKNCVPAICCSRTILSEAAYIYETIGIIKFYLSATTNVKRENVDFRYKQIMRSLREISRVTFRDVFSVQLNSMGRFCSLDFT